MSSIAFHTGFVSITSSGELRFIGCFDDLNPSRLVSINDLIIKSNTQGKAYMVVQGLTLEIKNFGGSPFVGYLPQEAYIYARLGNVPDKCAAFNNLVIDSNGIAQIDFNDSFNGSDYFDADKRHVIQKAPMGSKVILKSGSTAIRRTGGWFDTLGEKHLPASFPKGSADSVRAGNVASLRFLSR